MNRLIKILKYLIALNVYYYRILVISLPMITMQTNNQHGKTNKSLEIILVVTLSVIALVGVFWSGIKLW